MSHVYWHRGIITNSGGVDTQVLYKLSLSDARSFLLAEKTSMESVAAGSTISLSLPIPEGAVDGAYSLIINYQDLKTGKQQRGTNLISISGIKGALQVQTDKQAYLTSESISGLSTITNNGTMPIQDGTLHLQVVTAAGEQKKKIWTSQNDFQQGTGVGVDTLGINDWINADDNFDWPEIDAAKWIANGNITINSGKLLLFSPASTQSEIISKWQLDGDFDIEVDFLDNSSSIEDEGSELGVHIGNYKVMMKNTRRSGYFSGIHRLSDGVFITHKSSGSATYSTSGSFKIVKIGTTLITYTKQGANWVEHFRYTLSDLGNHSLVTILLWAGLGYPVTAVYDNFKVNSGRVVTSNETVGSVRLLPLNDNFDDAVSNTDRWVVRNLFGTSGSGVESNGKLNLAINGGKYGEVVEAVGKTKILQGDFSVQTSWNDFSSTARGAGTVAELALALDDDNYVYIKRMRSDSGDYIWRDVRVDGNWIGFASVGTAQTSGRFKISRSNSVVQTFYEDAGKWVELGTALTFKPDDVTPVLKLWMGAEGSASVSFDNFRVTPSKYAASGKLNLKHDAGQNAKWGSITFDANTPLGTSVKVRTRTATTSEALAQSSWSDYISASGSAIPSAPGRWIEIETTLDTTNTAVTPSLHDFTVSYGNNPDYIVWQTDMPVAQAAEMTSNFASPIGTLGAVGKHFLQGRLISATGQTLSSAEYPFYVEQGNIQLLLAPDKKIYRPGETVTVSGEIRNLSSTNAAGLLLQVKTTGVGGGTPFTGTIDLPANGAYPFSFTTTTETEGVYNLNGKVIQNRVTLAEIDDQYEAATPSVTANLAMPDMVVGTYPLYITLNLNNAGKMDATTGVSIVVTSRTNLGESSRPILDETGEFVPGC